MTTAVSVCILSMMSVIVAISAIPLLDQRQSLVPKDLFLCALGEDRASAQMSVCEHNFEVQQQIHNCASRRLLIVNIDRQIAYLEQTGFQAVTKDALQKMSKCQEHKTSESEQIAQIKELITIHYTMKTDLQMKKQEQITINEKLITLRDSVAVDNNRVTQLNRGMNASLTQLVKTLSSNRQNITHLMTNRFGLLASQIKATNLTTIQDSCRENRTRLLSQQLNCTTQELPNLRKKIRERNETLRAGRVAQGRLTTCSYESDNCPAMMSVCKTIAQYEQQTRVNIQHHDEFKKNKEICGTSLMAKRAAMTQCEAELDMAREIYHSQLVNTTMEGTQQKELLQQAVECDNKLYLCQDNVTSCQDYTAIVNEKLSGCLQKLDKWKFQTHVCTSHITMLWDNINSTAEFIAEMRLKVRDDEDQLDRCNDRQLYSQSAYRRVLSRLDSFDRNLAGALARVAVCHKACPQMVPRAPPPSRCPPAGYGLPWHDLASGCFLVTRPGAMHDRMEEYCNSSAEGAAIVRISSSAIAADVYAALIPRYLFAPRGEMLRQQRRAWVNFADGFRFVGTPERSYQCSQTVCECWSMRFGWKGRSQRYPCHLNLPAVCHVPHGGMDG